MALNATLTLEGERRGRVLGSATQRGREGSILVCACFHEIVCPRDPASGRPTGKRAHKPLFVTKEVDASSPALAAMLCTAERIVSFTLRFWQPTPTGAERQHFTVELSGARVASLQLRSPSPRSTKLARLPLLEEVGFTYQGATWTWAEGGLSASDAWESPR